MDLTRLDPERQQRRLKLLATLAEARAARVRRVVARAAMAAPRGAQRIIALRRRLPATSASLRADALALPAGLRVDPLAK